MNNNKRWLYLAVATVILLFQGLIYAWSLFRTPFSEIYTDWTVAQLSMTFTISISCFCLGGFVGGQLSKKLGVKVRFLITAVCLFIGFFGVSMLNPADSAGSLTKLYIFYGVFGGGGVGIGYNAVISTITKWFPDKVGLASGIMLMGFGLGSLLLGSVVTGMVAAQGLFPTFKILAIAITVVMVVGAIIIKAPEAPAAPAEAKAEEKEEKSTAVSFSAGEMLKTSRFWIFFLWAIALNSAGLMVINSAANISLAFGGSAILGMVVSLFNGAGRIIAGNNFDRFGRKKSTLINVSFMMIAGILLVLAGKISPAEARVHPQRNLITRSLGTASLVDVDVLHLDHRPGDVWLLCSDGLSNHLTERQLSRVLRTATGWEQKVDKLVNTALENGSTDNITCVIVTDEEAGK